MLYNLTTCRRTTKGLAVTNTYVTQLHRIRLKKGWKSRRAFAQTLGCSDEAVRNWERGRNFPHRRFQKRLLEVLHIPAAELLALEDKKGASTGGVDAP
jgi:DNA-binding transcriptional regulator YiaG